MIFKNIDALNKRMITDVMFQNNICLMSTTWLALS